MKNRIILILAAAVMLLGSLSIPTIVRADGNPNPNCNPGQFCKP
jgi:hypothetical protein